MALKFVLRFNTGKQKAAAEKRAKIKNQSLNGFILTLIDESEKSAAEEKLKSSKTIKQ